MNNYNEIELREKIEELEATKGWKIIVNEMVKYFKSVRNELETSIEKTNEKDIIRKGQLKAIRYFLNLTNYLKKNA